jgi:hypothetical protein
MRIVAIVVALWFISAYCMMITVGIAHGSWWSFIPTMGYFTALALTFIPYAVSVVGTLLKELSRD